MVLTEDAVAQEEKLSDLLREKARLQLEILKGQNALTVARGKLGKVLRDIQLQINVISRRHVVFGPPEETVGIYGAKG